MANHVDNPAEENQTNGSPAAEQNDQQTGAATAASTGTPAAQQSAAEAEEHQNEGMDFGAILQQFEQEQTIYHSGELVDGKVVGISDRGVLVDFGYKSEGV